MSLETSSAAAPQPIEKNTAVARKRAGTTGDSGEAAPTFSSVLTAIEPDASGDPAINAAAAHEAQEAPPVPVPPDAAALLAQNPNRMVKLDDLGLSVLTDPGPSAGAAPGELAALSGLAGQAEATLAGVHGSRRMDTAVGKTPAMAVAGKATGLAVATEQAANASTAQAVVAQHASTTQAMLRRADGDQALQEAGAQFGGKGLQARANDARLAADGMGADWRSSLPAQNANTLPPGVAMLDALGAFSRGVASPRSGDRLAVRSPFVPAGSALAGAWAERATSGGSSAAMTIYAPDATVAVPETAVAEKLNYWIARGVQNAELQLDAFGGGTVKVNISVQGQHAQVEFRSDQPEARKLLQDAMPQLGDMLKGEGLLLSGGFVGSSAQRDPGAPERKGNPRVMRSTIMGVEAQTVDGTPALSRTPGRAVDLFV